MSINIKELAKEEELLILEHRLNNLKITQDHGITILTTIVIDSNNVILTMHNNSTNRSEMVKLEDNHCEDLYKFLKARHNLKKTINEYKKFDNVFLTSSNF